MTHGVVRQALHETHGFRLLHEKSGKDITLFYLHDRAIEAHWRSFNQEFMAALGIEDQAEPPCMVFFRVLGEHIEDVSIYRIDEQTADPVLVVAELEQYLDDAVKRLNAEGGFSPLSGLSKVIGPIAALTKVGELLLKLKGLLEPWLDAQHQYVDTTPRPLPLPAPHAAIAVATAMVATAAVTARPTPRRAAAAVAIAAAAVVVVAVQGRAGREVVRLSRTHRPKCSR